MFFFCQLWILSSFICQANSSKVSLLERETDLTQQLAELSRERDERLVKLTRLRDDEGRLCRDLCEKPCEMSEQESVLSTQRIAHLQEYVLRLENEKVQCCADCFVYLLVDRLVLCIGDCRFSAGACLRVPRTFHVHITCASFTIFSLHW